jgi:hypothetical protein
MLDDAGLRPPDYHDPVSDFVNGVVGIPFAAFNIWMLTRMGEPGWEPLVQPLVTITLSIPTANAIFMGIRNGIHAATHRYENGDHLVKAADRIKDNPEWFLPK